MLDAGQSRLGRQAQTANVQRNPLVPVRPGMLGPRMGLHDAPRLRRLRSGIAAPAAAGRDDPLDHGPFPSVHDPAGLLAQCFLVGMRQSQHIAAHAQARQMPLEPRTRAVEGRQGLEQAVAASQAAIVEWQGLGRLAVHQHHAAAASSAFSSPRALWRVSSSSRSGTESITRPAPARRTTSSSCTVMVRMRIFRSRSPS